MEKLKSTVIFEKTLENSFSSQPFTLRVVKQTNQQHDSFILEKLERHDAMNNPVWMPIEKTESSLAIDTMGEFFDKLNNIDFRNLDNIVNKNIKLKKLLKTVLAIHHSKKNSEVDFDTTGQGERLLGRITKAIYGEFDIDEELIDELIIECKDSL